MTSLSRVDAANPRVLHLRALAYRFRHGLSVAETARLLGCTDRTVRRYTDAALSYTDDPFVAAIRERMHKRANHNAQHDDQVFRVQPSP